MKRTTRNKFFTLCLIAAMLVSLLPQAPHRAQAVTRPYVVVGNSFYYDNSGNVHLDEGIQWNAAELENPDDSVRVWYTNPGEQTFYLGVCSADPMTDMKQQSSPITSIPKIVSPSGQKNTLTAVNNQGFFKYRFLEEGDYTCTMTTEDGNTYSLKIHADMSFFACFDAKQESAEHYMGYSVKYTNTKRDFYLRVAVDTEWYSTSDYSVTEGLKGLTWYKDYPDDWDHPAGTPTYSLLENGKWSDGELSIQFDGTQRNAKTGCLDAWYHITLNSGVTDYKVLLMQWSDNMNDLRFEYGTEEGLVCTDCFNWDGKGNPSSVDYSNGFDPYNQGMDIVYGDRVPLALADYRLVGGQKRYTLLDPAETEIEVRDAKGELTDGLEFVPYEPMGGFEEEPYQPDPGFTCYLVRVNKMTNADNPYYKVNVKGDTSTWLNIRVVLPTMGFYKSPTPSEESLILDWEEDYSGRNTVYLNLNLREGMSFELLDDNTQEDGSNCDGKSIYDYVDVTKLSDRCYKFQVKPEVKENFWLQIWGNMTMSGWGESDTWCRGVSMDAYTGSEIPSPSQNPTPSTVPGSSPSAQPTIVPSVQPTLAPSTQPTIVPSAQPSTVTAPAKVSISKATSKSRKMTVTWKKASRAVKYQIYYSLKSNFSKKTVKTTKSTSLTVSKLKKGKTYYVKVRAYCTNSAGKKVYGKWSKTTKIKIK